MPWRTPRQCRERYNAYLCPTINSTPWSAAEDELLLAQFSRHGSQWAEYRSFFKRRTLAAIRNRLRVLLSREWRDEQDCSLRDQSATFAAT
jgi:hypothetical protein